MLIAAHKANRLKFFSDHVPLADFTAFAAWISQLREVDWWLYAKPPFGGPKPVLAYLSRYTHRIAMSNRQLWRGTTLVSHSTTKIVASKARTATR